MGFFLLNKQFVSAYTRKDSSKIPTKGPNSHSSMEPIEVQSKGVHKLLLNLKIHKAARPEFIPNVILKIAADLMAPSLPKIVSDYDQEIPQSQTADNPPGTARKSRSTITRHQEDKLSKAISSLFPIKMIAILEWT